MATAFLFSLGRHSLSLPALHIANILNTPQSVTTAALYSFRVPWCHQQKHFQSLVLRRVSNSECSPQIQEKPSETVQPINVLATKGVTLSVIPRTHIVERENQLLQVVPNHPWTLWHAVLSKIVSGKKVKQTKIWFLSIRCFMFWILWTLLWPSTQCKRQYLNIKYDSENKKDYSQFSSKNWIDG